MRVRPPAVAGQFYEGSAEKLRQQVLRCLPKHPLATQEALGTVVPHAGLMYSGAVAGSVYASLVLPATVVLLGPNHTGEGAPLSLTAADSWETPLGRSEVDQEFAQRLLKALPGLKQEEDAHQWEHSLEVQLPFLQHLGKGIRIVPVVLGFGSIQAYQEVGERVAEVIREFPRSVLVLASSDMTHYEPHEEVKAKDGYAIEAILALDEKGLVKRIRERNISMCGVAPTVAMLSCVKSLGATSGRLVKYQTSGDSSGDYSAVVGYAGIVIQ